MSHDRRFNPAALEDLHSADDTSYSICTTRKQEPPMGQMQPGYLAYDTQWMGSFGVDIDCSYEGSWDRVGGVENPATLVNEETSHSARQRTSESEFLNPTDLGPPSHQSVESLQDHTVEARSLEDSTLGKHRWHELGNDGFDHAFFDDDFLHTPQESSNEHVAQTSIGKHLGSSLDLSYAGTQFGLLYPQRTDLSGLLERPFYFQRHSNDTSFDWHSLRDTTVKDASSLIPMSSTASDWSSMTIETLARSTQSENPISTTSSLSSEVVNGGRDQETLSCAFCPAKFAGIYARGNYGRHRRQKHVDHNREFQCEVSHCPKVFRRHDARLKHYRRQHPDLVHNSESGNDWHARRRRASCTDETRGGQQDYLSPKNRLQSTGGDSEMIYMDTTPSTPTMVVNELSTEVIRQEGENIRCDICQKEFNRAAELRRHKDSVHNLNSLQYFCEVPGCDRASRPFPRKDKLADHTARVHTQALALRALEHGEEALQPTYHCDYQGCERTFDQRADLLRHQRTHTDKSERPHKCAQCEQSFLYPKDLRRHQATHLDNEDDDKPSFHCEVASCEYGAGRQGFSRRDGMIRHMRRFHPELIADEET